jgi:hypothetical protein
MGSWVGLPFARWVAHPVSGQAAVYIGRACLPRVGVKRSRRESGDASDADSDTGVDSDTDS